MVIFCFHLKQSILSPYFRLLLRYGIGESGNQGSGNRGIGEYGNGKRYRYAVCGIINNYHIQVYSQKIKGIPHGIQPEYSVKSAVSEKLLKWGIWRLKALQRKEAYQSIALGLQVSKIQQSTSYVKQRFHNRATNSGNRGIGEYGNYISYEKILNDSMQFSLKLSHFPSFVFICFIV